MSVLNSEMLVEISDILEMPVSTLLGETFVAERKDELKVISEKLEIINLQLSQRCKKKRKLIHCMFISVYAIIVAIFVILFLLKSPYLGWDYSEPETAVLGVAFHSIEWLFVRLAPFALILIIIGVIRINNES